MELPNTNTQIFTLFIFLLFQLVPVVFTFPNIPNIINPLRAITQMQAQQIIPNHYLQPQSQSQFRPPAQPQPQPPETEQQQFLNAHNKVRAHVGLTPFVWDDTLASFALSWANRRIPDCRMIHSFGPYGENIFWGGRDHWTAEDAVRLWVKEHRFYDRRTNACLPERLCGHYTQIVWRNSTKLGCARVKCSTGGVFIMCNYDPPGNIMDRNPFAP
ncbi:PREDICTED: pathogenesis-related protein 1C [Theobroma cacao]|uniref:Pathogenesis-related protein 1C n=1 Tax=Theobroma cacao TaxID=3641 RepID=A0AB32VRW0_THECC|nr:PREDICTED: pathogenesis-related protein 1C [Theobroma cacao]